MNLNSVFRIERMVKDINTDKFDQELISSLMICIREEIPTQSMLREVCDFIAHAKLKDRGRVFNNIKKVHESLLKSYDPERNQLNGKITIELPIDINNQFLELERNLVTIDGNLKINNTEKRKNEIQSCLLLLLQGSRIKVENLKGVESVELKIAVNQSKHLCLMAVLPTPLIDPNQKTPTYVTEIKYEIITSTIPFKPEYMDACGFGFFSGIMNARRNDNGQIVYSLIRQKTKQAL